MEEVRPTPKIDSTALLRGKRGAAGLVAQYIHELSDRSRDARRGNATAARATRSGAAGRVAEPCTEFS